MTNAVTLLLSIIAAVTMLPFQSNGQFDVFPLRTNSYFQYAYYSRQWGGNILDGYVTVVDSGMVEYTVRDSVFLNDTTIAWNITQEYTLLHSYQHTWREDSMYWMSDSTTASLLESTIGRHSLSISSRVWDFPFRYPEDPSQTVYRYADSSHVLIAVSLRIFGSPGGSDSVWFSHYSGLHRREKSTCYSHGMTAHSYRLSIELLSDPVLSVADFVPSSGGARLFENFPNPFNPSTQIVYRISGRESVELKIFDLLGREVASLVKGEQEPGEYSVQWRPEKIPSGVYIYRLNTSHATIARKMLFLK